MTMKSSPRVIVASICSVLLILLLNACGIETFIQLNPPSNPERTGDNKFSFMKTSSNNEQSFTGFELYYKFYGYSDDPSDDFDDIIEFEDLVAKGYRRIHDSTDKAGQIKRPLISINLNDRYPDTPLPPNNTNDTFTLSIYLSGAPVDLVLIQPVEYPIIVDDGNTLLIDGGEPQLTGPVPILFEITDIRRDVYDSSDDSYKKFSDFDSTDGDIQGIDTSYNLQFVVYALSYGLDVAGGTFRSLYSEPVRLGTIERIFPLSE